ncbi:MAG: hypothetical protein BGO69_08585 [Bacteroidetes bacterium 46-16]|nr:MAG: hypothetical protein BGO69_08585 [Bacteroidetes bacterium 46-16]
MNKEHYQYVKQYLFLGIIILLAFLIGWQLYPYFPGLLGAITLYILLRHFYFYLIVIKRLPRNLTAVLLIIASIIVFIIPFVLLVQLLLPEVYRLTAPGSIDATLSVFSGKMTHFLPFLKPDSLQVDKLSENINSSIPRLLGSTVNVMINLILLFFTLFFMLVQGREMEKRIQRFLPLQEHNIDDIWQATRTMVVANAVGIPLLALAQAISATLGYYIFGLDDFVLWGVVTGLFSLFPAIGTAAIWIPVCIFFIASGKVSAGIGLFVYSLIVIVNVDNILRFTILKKIGDVHPVITLVGILVGLPMFGFMGFIFGPLLISYLLLLVRIYNIEFAPKADKLKVPDKKRSG